MSVRFQEKASEPMREPGSFEWINHDALILGLACGHEVVHHPFRPSWGGVRMVVSHPPMFTAPQMCPICGDVNYSLFVAPREVIEAMERSEIKKLRRERQGFWGRIWAAIVGEHET